MRQNPHGWYISKTYCSCYVCNENKQINNSGFKTKMPFHSLSFYVFSQLWIYVNYILPTIKI